MASSRTPGDESDVLLGPSRIGRFALIREIGVGGMGSVFAAYDEQLDRKVALKILRRVHAGSQIQRLRTLREARAAARISHPNVISIYEVGEADGNIHIAMEYIDGGTLLTWQAQGGRSWRDILAMYLQIGAGLQAAHEAEVVHRDFKPDNVLLGQDGRPRVVDFGLARVESFEPQVESEVIKGPVEIEVDPRTSGRLTLPGVISGTPGYMSPEQYRGGDVDFRSDQWSFCSALFEALYGYLPFEGKTIRETSEKVHGAPRQPPADNKVPIEVHRALVRGLAADPEKRFPSMAELLAILEQELQGDMAAGGASRKRFSQVLVGLVVVVMALLQLRQSRKPPTPREAAVATVFMLTVLLLGGLWRRRTLLENRFHRNVWIILMVSGLQNLLQRLVAIVLDLPMSRLFLFEMIVMAGASAMLSITMFRRLRFMPALPLGAGLLALVLGHPPRVLSVVYPLLVLLCAIGWSGASRAGSTSGARRDSLPGVPSRGRRTPSRPSDRSSARGSARSSAERTGPHRPVGEGH